MNSLKKIVQKQFDKNQESYLLDVLNDYLRYYSELHQRSGSVWMEAQRKLYYEVFKTLNCLNQTFMKEIFYRSPS